MATMNVSLPDQMKAWVEAQTETGRYGNASDYVRDLIRRDQERREKIAEFQRLIDEGRASGIGRRTFVDIRESARKRAKELGADGA
ncbi:type II toxin-antitoxin system ParD family antitoxin [Bosea sp. 124]|uniref:type II toxin-antitoxin system ParD family antitoxin n=1 Tax=Bosea sp. 124 TaxID=2135642 RepID=UPI000D3A7F8C|nr:type II toxin-antitoxin system ParD family antitoxin [Bosea sp. 124]PTM40162.1 antitoxin ParD1/3/4 [Bosea sp. 124]